MYKYALDCDVLQVTHFQNSHSKQFVDSENSKTPSYILAPSNQKIVLFIEYIRTVSEYK